MFGLRQLTFACQQIFQAFTQSHQDLVELDFPISQTFVAILASIESY